MSAGDLSLTFGKHAGKSLVEVHASDTGYVTWLAQQSGSTSHRMRLAAQSARNLLRGIAAKEQHTA